MSVLKNSWFFRVTKLQFLTCRYSSAKYCKYYSYMSWAFQLTDFEKNISFLILCSQLNGIR